MRRIVAWDHFKALIGGYFWEECPLCGEMFGGNEKLGYLYTGRDRGINTCERCTAEAKRITKIRWKEEEARGVYVRTDGTLQFGPN